MNRDNINYVISEDRRLILGLLAEGWNVYDIAVELGVTPDTVENIQKGERHDKEGTRDEALADEPRPE